MMRCKTVTAFGWIAVLILFALFVIAPALSDGGEAAAVGVEACEVVYADSFDIREAVIADELDPYNALLLGPVSYHPMVLEAFETSLSPKMFSARWLGMCLAGRIEPRSV